MSIEIYTTPACPFCVLAKKLLTERGLAYREIDASAAEARAAMMDRADGRRTVPQIFIRGQGIGGYDALAALDRQGKLLPLLAGP